MYHFFLASNDKANVSIANDFLKSYTIMYGRLQLNGRRKLGTQLLGVKKLSPGCKFCYTEVMSRCLKAMGVDKCKNGFNIGFTWPHLNVPFTWKKLKVVFVNSMSQLFHDEIPIKFI
jgi:hypothetical protein